MWRAAFQVAESRNPAASVTGPSLANSEAGQWQLSLHRRAAEVSRADQSAQRWAPYMTQPQILTDPWWPILARRLSLAQRAGMDVPQLLAEAITRGPLPDEHAAAALWWRLADTLAPAAAARETTAAKVRPDWTHQLVDQLPAGVADSVLADPEWPALVAAIDTATRDGMDPAQVIAAAASGLNLVDPERDDYINVDDVAVMLTWRVNDLHHDHTSTGSDQQAMVVVAAEPEDLLFPDAPPPDPYDDEFAPPPPEEAVAPVAGVARIVELNQAAAAFYAEQYPGSRAADYVTARFGSDLSQTDGITIGYALASWDSLTQQLRTVCAATNDELIDAGLAKYSKRGTLIDVFRDRVMLGIRDQHQQLVGFTGRAAPGAPADVPKYMNTPTTAAFHKGEVLYGLGEHTGTGAVPVLAEGAFDALAISLAGDGKVFGVAPCGTSLTLAQAELLAQASLTVRCSWPPTRTHPVARRQRRTTGSWPASGSTRTGSSSPAPTGSRSKTRPSCTRPTRAAPSPESWPCTNSRHPWPTPSWHPASPPTRPTSTKATPTPTRSPTATSPGLWRPCRRSSGRSGSAPQPPSLAQTHGMPTRSANTCTTPPPNGTQATPATPTATSTTSQGSATTPRSNSAPARRRPDHPLPHRAGSSSGLNRHKQPEVRVSTRRSARGHASSGRRRP